MSLRRRIRSRIGDPEDKRRYVRDLFDGIARRYDLTNDVMSFGLHRYWKRRVLRVAAVRPGHTVLDLATGTGDLAFGAARALEGRGRVVGADLTTGMMRIGQERAAQAAERAAPATPDELAVRWVAADARTLPFPDRAFDRVLIGYGLRNFADLESCLSEILRCLRPGGRLVALDFGHPRRKLLRRLYLGYLDASTRVVGWALHRNPEAYVYIPESLRRFPGQRAVARTMERIGFARCGVVDLLGGAMAINFGARPAEGPTPGDLDGPAPADVDGSTPGDRPGIRRTTRSPTSTP